MAVSTIREFLKHESAGGLILLAVAALALVLDNSPVAWLYDMLLELPVAVRFGALEIAKPLLLWINDGLMAVFFLLVALEIKREVVEGELSTRDRASLPVIAAIGGMAVPAAIYVAVAGGDPVAARGWAIPAATDIAFALGILSLLGNRVPLALKVFLLALAIIDDLGAIIIIAVFYTENLSLLSLALAGLGAAGLLALNLGGATRTAAYILVGTAVWVCVLKSGVHATLAGVLVGFAVPLQGRTEYGESPLRALEHTLHPWVAFGIMPAFASANAGVALGGFGLSSLAEPVTLGIALGLLLGKQAGILAFVWLGVRLRLCRLPEGIGWAQVYGIACLAGIGFTMSLFIGTLAFEDPGFAAPVRIGVLAGSLASGLLGYLVLWAALPPVRSALRE
jgi:NhaA family Na+:H+ antiporter